MWSIFKRHHHQDGQPFSFIFDFDGTISNTLPLVIEIVERWSLSTEPLTIDKVEALRGMSAQQALKVVGIPIHKVPSLLTRGRRELTSQLDRAQPIKGMPEQIEKLAKSNHLYVMSSNSTQNIQHLLHNYGLSKYFKAVFGGVSIFGKTKMLKKIIAREQLDMSRCVYVGDETRDVEAAHKLGLKVAAVTWGYNNKKILAQFKPDYLIEKPSDLAKIPAKQ